MSTENILLILLAIVASVCGVALMFACCKASNWHNHHHHHHHLRETVHRTLKSPDEISLGLIVDFNAHDFSESVECVVCLSELADGETAKVLPNCNHWFHVECIDIWLQSEFTCPICRDIVGSQPRLSVASSISGETVVNIPVVEP